MGNDESRRETLDECVRLLLEACVALRDEVARLPRRERESAAYRKFHVLDEAIPLNADVADEIRVRIVDRARETEGPEFAAWVTGIMGAFPGGASTPPVSSRRTPKE